MMRAHTRANVGERHVARWIAIAAAACLFSPALGEDRTAPSSSPSMAASSPGLSPEQIRMVQRSLGEKGYDVAVTSTWDDGTRSALASFQRSRNLPATGELDPATSQALGFDASSVLPVRGVASPGAGGPYERYDPDDLDVNCGVNDTVDCRYGGG